MQTINQLLTEMDGFDDNTGVIVMAATNRPATLDTALTRPGRFDRIIHLPYPNLQVVTCKRVWSTCMVYRHTVGSSMTLSGLTLWSQCCALLFKSSIDKDVF